MNNKIDETVDEVLNYFIKQASNREELKESVSVSLQHAIHEVVHTIQDEFKEDLDTGFGFAAYENLEVYLGPTRLLDMDVDINESFESSDNESGQKQSIKNKDGSVRHGEIIIKVPKGHKVHVKATDNDDTVISNIYNGEVIIRNIDTNLILSICHNNCDEISDGDFVEMSILGQAYIKDLQGVIKVNEFKGIIVIKSEN
jgi:hypothetical protein